MDFPIFHLDFLGNRLLIAVIAITHVLINHGLAVGAVPLIAYLEKRGMDSGDPRWDVFAYRFLVLCFLVTTSLGAMTGVGIWFSASLVNPYSIGSLLRIFFWGWFAEWIVFVTEICLMLAYFLTWKSWTGERKRMHNRLGWLLAFFSWVTMALIVAVLGFMMHSGLWCERPSFWSAFLNPLYLPQLSFRTPLALATAGLLGLGLTRWLCPADLRHSAIRLCAGWTLCWLPPLAGGGWLYWSRVPALMRANLPTALTTLEYLSWSQQVLWLLAVAVTLIFIVCCWALLYPYRMPAVVAAVPFLLTLGLLGTFERIREFIRKPYVIQGYMYSNGYRLEDYPLLQRDGVLRHANFIRNHQVTSENQLAAGRDVFLLTCTRCHTTQGVNGVVPKLERLLGSSTWNEEAIANYLTGMHGSRPFMPPFPGNQNERKALASYLASLRNQSEQGLGAQEAGLWGTLP